MSSPEGGISRPALFAGLMSIGFLNGCSERLSQAITAEGPLGALFNTFDISTILWGAAVAALMLLLQDSPIGLKRGDIGGSLLVALAFLVPIPALSWLALGGMAIWLYLTSAPGGLTGRAAGIIFAITIPAFWARLIFAACSEFLLRIDSVLVGLFAGTTPHDNIVPFRDGSGVIFVAPGCSSFSNVSLAILCSAAFMNFLGVKWSGRTLAWVALACLAVVAINVVRIGLIAFYPGQYDLIHGPIGATLAGWVTVAVILAVCVRGIGRHAAAAH